MAKKLTPKQRLNEAFEAKNVRSARSILTKHGHEMNLSPEEATMFIHTAIVRLQNANVLELLLKMGAKPDENAVLLAVNECWHSKRTLGGDAESLAMLDLLLEHGAKTYASCIRRAAERDCTKALKSLLNAGGNPCAFRNAPLNGAVYYGCYRSVQILKEYGASSDDVKPQILKRANELSKTSAEYAATIMALQGAKVEID